MGKHAKESRGNEGEAVCWHCGDVLAWTPKPRCENCPDECDKEGCDAYGCDTAAQSAVAGPTEDAVPRRLTGPEITHLLALLGTEKESGSYYGSREQYYARAERLIKWCNEQIQEASNGAGR